MQLYWHELIGSMVVDVHGHSVGRLTDLVAMPDGDGLQVVALLVGRRGLISRIAHPQWLHQDAYEIPWTRVSDIDRRTITLRANPENAEPRPGP